MITIGLRSSRNPLFPAFGLFVACLASATVALASLGDDAGSLGADGLPMPGALTVVTHDRYTIREIALPSGTLVREFVSPAGRVFGVAWRGPFMPDLRQILGAYFERYVAALAARHGRRGPLFIQSPDLVVETAGHLRSWMGRAYLPGALPPGVDPHEIL